MATNFDRFKTDLDGLLKLGFNLQMAMTLETDTARFKAAVKKAHGNESDAFLKTIPSFKSEYQRWYSESLTLYVNYCLIALLTLCAIMKNQKEGNQSISRIID